MADQESDVKRLTETQAIYRKANFYILRTKWQQLHGRSKAGQLDFYTQIGISRTAYGRVLADEIEVRYMLPGHLVRKIANSCHVDEAFLMGDKLIKIDKLNLVDWKAFFVNSYNNHLERRDPRTWGRNKLSENQMKIRDCVLAENFEEHKDNSIRKFCNFAQKDLKKVSLVDIASLMEQITIEHIETIAENQFNVYYKALEHQYKMAECVKKYKAYKNK